MPTTSIKYRFFISSQEWVAKNSTSLRQASRIEIEGIVPLVAYQDSHRHSIGRHRALQGVLHEERWSEVVVHVVVDLHT